MLDFAVLLALLALIIVVARLAGAAVARIGIPPVVGEIGAGVLLGPSLLGVQLSQDLFPVDQRGFLDVLARVGLVLFMFVVGLELDLSLVRGREKVAVSVSLTSLALPFALGIGLVTLGGIMLFIAFHNLDPSIRDLSGLLGAFSDAITGKGNKINVPQGQ